MSQSIQRLGGGGGTPWQAVFVAYCNGVPEDELASVFDIQPSTLHNRIQNESWVALRAKLPLGPTTDLPAKLNAKLALLAENREKNLAVFTTLRDDLLEVLAKLRDGSLKLEKQFHNKGSVVRADVDPSIVDRVNLATYAQTIAQGTYRALGDYQAQEGKPGQDAAVGATVTSQPAITIILPGAVSAPREMRQVSDAKGGQVIDLRSLGEPTPEPAKLPPPEPGGAPS